MTRIQIQFPDLLYQRLKTIAEQQDGSLAEVMRNAARHSVSRFPETGIMRSAWSFPTLNCSGDFLTDPRPIRPKLTPSTSRSGS